MRRTREDGEKSTGYASMELLEYGTVLDRRGGLNRLHPKKIWASVAVLDNSI